MKSVQIRSSFGPYCHVFRLNKGKYGPEKYPYLGPNTVIVKDFRDFKSSSLPKRLKKNNSKNGIWFLHLINIRISRFHWTNTCISICSSSNKL